MQETTLIEQDQPVGAILSPAPAPAPTMTLCSCGTKLNREELARVATPLFARAEAGPDLKRMLSKHELSSGSSPGSDMIAAV
jgi:hypothetical protein